MRKSLSKAMIATAAAAGGGVAWLTTSGLALAADSASLVGGVNASKAKESVNSLTGALGIVTNILFFVIGAAAVIFMIVGGLSYITSQGNEKKVASAKDTIMYSVIGIVVALISYALVTFVLSQFSVK